MGEAIERLINWSIQTRFEMNPLTLGLSVLAVNFVWNRRVTILGGRK